MIDFIDPVLKSSVRGHEVSRKSIDNVTKTLIAIIIIGFITWIVFVFMTSRIDTKAQKTINVDLRIESMKVEGRLKPIQDTR